MALMQFPGTNFHDLNLDWLLSEMKKCLEQWATTQDDWHELQANNTEFKEFMTGQWEGFRDFVLNYLHNLPLTEEVSAKIDQMVEDGTLLELITYDEGEGSALSDVTAQWLAAHITQETGYVIDDSLTVEGAAADAKATGDAITELKGALSEDGQNTERQISVSPNLIIKEDCIWNEYVTSSSIVQNAGQLYGHTAPIYVNAGVSYKFKVSTLGYGTTYAASYMRVMVDGSYTTGGSLGTITDGFVTFTPIFNGYITVNVYKNDQQMLCKTVDYPASYVDGKYINNFAEETASDLLNTKQIVFVNSPISATLVRDGGCYMTESGYISTSSSAEQRLCAAKIIKNTVYKIYAHLVTGTTSTSYAFFDKQTIPQEGDTAYNQTRYSHDGYLFEITAPINGWIVFKTKAGYNDETIMPITPTDNIARTTKDDNPLFGKMIAVDGDSICYGNGYIGGYAKMIADKNAMYYQNLAVGGATIVTGTQASGVNRHWISTSMENISTNADYILIEGGANDSSMSSVVMGALTETYNATLDTTTFYGAMETIFKTLTTKYVGKKYGFIITHGILHSFMPGGTFYQAVYDCAEKWGVPILDLTKYVPPFNQFRQDETLDAVRSTYTTSGDGWHPTELCYQQYYVPVIESWMKTL